MTPVLTASGTGSGGHNRGRVPRDESGDRRGHGRGVCGNREVVATLEVDVLALREQRIVEAGNL